MKGIHHLEKLAQEYIFIVIKTMNEPSENVVQPGIEPGSPDCYCLFINVFISTLRLKFPLIVISLKEVETQCLKKELAAFMYIGKRNMPIVN